MFAAAEAEALFLLREIRVTKKPLADWRRAARRLPALRCGNRITRRLKAEALFFAQGDPCDEEAAYGLEESREASAGPYMWSQNKNPQLKPRRFFWPLIKR